MSEPLDRQYLRKIRLLNDTIESLLAENESFRAILQEILALAEGAFREDGIEITIAKLARQALKDGGRT